jgi:4a-hydroxytetrahydrobiopterin dehydratase
MQMATPDELAHALTTLRWTLDGGALTQVTRHKDFADALAFVNAVGALAEAANHHPDIDIRWDTVTLRLLTHSRGGITDADLELAAEIDCLT